MYINYSIKSSKGKFYRSSKEKTAEFTVEAKDKEGNVYWHEEHDTVGGELVGLRLQEPPFGGEQLGIILQDGEDRKVIQINVLRDATTVDGWARAFAYYLDKLEIGDNLTFSLNKKNKDDAGYLYKNVFIQKDKEKVEWAFEYKDIPQGVETINKLTKKKTMDYSDANEFLYGIITRNVERLGTHKEEAKAEAPVTDNVDVEDDGLPF